MTYFPLPLHLSTIRSFRAQSQNKYNLKQRRVGLQFASMLNRKVNISAIPPLSIETNKLGKEGYIAKELCRKLKENGKDDTLG